MSEGNVFFMKIAFHIFWGTIISYDIKTDAFPKADVNVKENNDLPIAENDEFSKIILCCWGGNCGIV